MFLSYVYKHKKDDLTTIEDWLNDNRHDDKLFQYLALDYKNRELSEDEVTDYLYALMTPDAYLPDIVPVALEPIQGFVRALILFEDDITNPLDILTITPPENMKRLIRYLDHNYDNLPQDKVRHFRDLIKGYIRAMKNPSDSILELITNKHILFRPSIFHELSPDEQIELLTRFDQIDFPGERYDVAEKLRDVVRDDILIEAIENILNRYFKDNEALNVALELLQYFDNNPYVTEVIVNWADRYGINNDTINMLREYYLEDGPDDIY